MALTLLPKLEWNRLREFQRFYARNIYPFKYSTVLSEGITEKPARENYHLQFQQKINRIKTRIKENIKQIVPKQN